MRGRRSQGSREQYEKSSYHPVVIITWVQSELGTLLNSTREGKVDKLSDTFLCGYSVPRGWVASRNMPVSLQTQPVAYAPPSGSHPPAHGWSVPWYAPAAELPGLTPAPGPPREEPAAAAAGPRPSLGPPPAHLQLQKALFALGGLRRSARTRS